MAFDFDLSPAVVFDSCSDLVPLYARGAKLVNGGKTRFVRGQQIVQRGHSIRRKQYYEHHTPRGKTRGYPALIKTHEENQKREEQLKEIALEESPVRHQHEKICSRNRAQQNEE